MYINFSIYKYTCSDRQFKFYEEWNMYITESNNSFFKLYQYSIAEN